MPSFESDKVVYRTVVCERCGGTAEGIWDIKADSFSWACSCTSFAVVGLARSPDGPVVHTAILRERFRRCGSIRFRYGRCPNGTTTFVHPVTQSAARVLYLIGDHAILELSGSDQTTFQICGRYQNAGRISYDLSQARYYRSFAEAFCVLSGQPWMPPPPLDLEEGPN